MSRFCRTSHWRALPCILRKSPLGWRTTLLLLLCLTALPVTEAKVKWDDVNPADLAAKDSAALPGADFETLFTRETLEESGSETIRATHVQAKIYTQSGVERSSVFSIDYPKLKRAFRIEARVVKPDGSFAELSKQDFHETSVFKVRGEEWKRINFAFPNLQPGDVIEYRWAQALLTGGFVRYYTLFPQQRDVPVREYSFEAKSADADFQVMWFNCQVERANQKSRKIILRNLPPFIEEPFMPPATEFRSWILILFSHPYLRWYDGDSGWKMIGDFAATDFRLSSAPNRTIKAKVGELLTGISDPVAKVARLYAFTQSAVRNLDRDDSAELADAKKKRDRAEYPQSPHQTLERRYGKQWDITLLFASLTQAAGFQTRLAMSADRDEILNINSPRGWIMANRHSVLVKIGDDWRCYTPAEQFVPSHLLGPKDAGAMMYVCDEKKCWWYTAPVAGPESTETRRTGRFSINEEGTLEGSVQIELTGHRALIAREAARDESAEEAIKAVREALASRMPTAEISDFERENLTDNTQPLIIRYKLQVPGYAEVIGNRIAFPINCFKAGTTETFTHDTRRYGIFFDFAQTEHDDVQIVLPEGYTLDGGSSPAPVGTPQDIVNAQYNLKYAAKSRTLIYRRDYVLGRGGVITFQAQSYEPLRRLLGSIHRSDLHQLMLKPRPAPAVSATPAPAAVTGATP